MANSNTIKPPFPLFALSKACAAEGEQIVAWACGLCGRVHQTEDIAALCCGPRKCEDCGVEVANRTYTVCPSCLAKRNVERERSRFEKAEKIKPEDYDGVVYWENENSTVVDVSPYGSLGDGYWESIGALEEACEEAEVPLPDYVYACREILARTDAACVVERTLEDFYEDAIDHISDEEYDKLQKFLDNWWDGIGITGYEQDTGRVIVLKPEGGN